MIQHFIRIVNSAVTGSLRTDQRTAVGPRFSSDYTVFKCDADTLILAEQVTDFSGTNSDITGRDVRIRPNIVIKACHKGLAESHDFPVALSSGIKIRTALRSPHGKACQRILESLLKSQEKHDTGGHCGMETEAAFVGTDGRVKLYTVSAIDLGEPVVIHPGNTE